MNKFISYTTIFIALYLQLSITNLNEVNADEILTNTGNSIIYSENTLVTPEENYFVVTAYYSPIPDQKHYLRGNYQDEIILNGRGIRGASGKDVFPGMFAGPKSYPFGTKIYLEGIGTGEIADRGGAIVSTATGETRGYQYDRVDVWMGFGEEGLKRALAWGKRTVKGNILVDQSLNLDVDLSKLPAPDSVVKNLVYKPHIEKNTDPRFVIFDKYIGPESSEDNIKELQKIFVEMGIYSGIVDGKYNNIKDTLINYQIKLGVIDIKSDDGAGYFGPKTRAKAKTDYITYIDTKTKAQEEAKRKEFELAQIKENVKNKVEKHIASIGSPKPGDIGENVRTLQKTLKTLGYLNIKDSAIFGDKTKLGLIKYQLDKGVIKTKNESGAGAFGPKTKEVLKNELVAVLEKQALKEKNLLSYKK